MPAVTGHSEDENDSTVLTRRADDGEKFSALAFKLMTDPFVGQLTFVRVYSGVLSKGDLVYNPIRGRKERIGRIVQMHAMSARKSTRSAPATLPPVWASRR
ncbi:EF-Tu/IF-2/RF-3 family GTPase [Comamonas sp. JC664]|uniref:EF-Tu/IF-2/RF-3 family GTPase n=1 Tax=Comamonas sp. JC664 TaxID=2801917 RepID=UPI003623D1CD